MTSDLRYQVFLSSTYEDLREERQQATQAILEMAHMPAGMELFPASDLSQWELIKAVISDSDYYVVIIGGRYGSVHSVTGLSFTEMEYDYACSIGIPVLGFVRKNVGQIASEKSENDPVNREKLSRFREKVMSKTCRQFENPAELGMMIMKSLMSEVRINPRIGWVRADKARNQEDVEREQSLIDDVTRKEKEITALKRQIRDRSIPLRGVESSDLASGDDLYDLTVLFKDGKNKNTSDTIQISWDDIFSVVAPSMYGYIMRRGSPAYGKVVGTYTFESGLTEYIRSKHPVKFGTRQISLLPHEVDDILIQFRQLGLMAMDELEKENGHSFRGYTLTEAGEEHLTRMRVKLKPKDL